jgi:dephospho-CoA kinase
MLIGIVGLHGAGKDTVAQYLVESYGFAHKDLGQEIRDELVKTGRNHLDRTEMVNLANELRQKFGFNYWCKRAIESVNAKDIVITSLRNPAEVDEIKSRSGIIIAVKANLQTRYERVVERVKNSNLHGNVKDFDHFKAEEERELESTDPAKQQLLKCIAMAEYTIDNNGSIAQLDNDIQQLMQKLGKNARKP